jgi:hypothetical protein
MASITYWSRLETRPRSKDIKRSLAAQVRDPLWFLTRQWQLGEFLGEDAASPAYIQFAARFSPIDGWQTGDSKDPVHSYAPCQAPLEALIEREPFTPDWATSVELGQHFESALRPPKSGLTEQEANVLIQRFRHDYAIPNPSQEPGAAQDRELAHFLRVCAGHATNGVELYHAAQQALPDLPDKPTVDADHVDAVKRALEELVKWVADVYGELSTSDATAWRPERLEYDAQVWATTPEGGNALLDAHPGRFGTFDWFAFDQRGEGAEPEGDAPPAGCGESVTRSLLPIHVRFRGMPNARWWQFEDGTVDFADIRPDLREIAKLIVMDFMLVHSNDWFVVPFSQPVGTLCRVEALLVHDVFGGTTSVERADREALAAAESTTRWTMFSTTTPSGLADFFIMPPSASTLTPTGETLEEVRFMRDEMANMVWAIEHTTQNGLGLPWPGHERVMARQPAERDSVAGSPPLASLQYLIQTDVPENWIPFVPVLINRDQGQIALQRAVMMRPEGSQEPLVRPVGRILQPSHLDNPNRYRVYEEEVPREGVRVSRAVQRSRWTDGSTHLWIARGKRPGGGEGSSGLRFDIVMPTQARDRVE